MKIQSTLFALFFLFSFEEKNIYAHQVDNKSDFIYIYFLSYLQTRAPSKLSAMFSGTQEKCQVCKRTVYPLEKVCDPLNLSQQLIFLAKDILFFII